MIGNGNYDTSTESNKFYSGVAFGDSIIFNEHKQEMERIFLYNVKIKSVKIAAQENIEIYKIFGNSFESRRSENFYNTFGNRQISHYYQVAGFEKLFSYDFSSIYVLLLILFVVVPVFLGEYEKGMDLIIKSSKKGRRATVFAKTYSAL